jgi:two-component system nitrogen regulation response regulator GlnG
MGSETERSYPSGGHNDDQWLQVLETRTREEEERGRVRERLKCGLLTVLWHADPTRVGARRWLHELAEGQSVELSRLQPLFGFGAEPAIALADPHLSRTPIQMIPRPEGIALSCGPEFPELEVDSERVSGFRELSWQEIDRGVVLLLGGRVALVLEREVPPSRRPPDFGLVGGSPALVRLRVQIERLADLDLPVLLRGESGTGKELVARALQAHGRRQNGPFLSVNVAAIPETLAAAELFGAARGAFSGADRARSGFFEQAHRGTLFLDEIGEASARLQALLLRVLENGEIQPVGAERPRRVDVRVLAATDAALEIDLGEGRFSRPLFERLRALELTLPPLRRRIQDLGPLLLHFLRIELRNQGEEDRLRDQGPWVRPYVSARLVARLALHDWPGNVRELRNEVRRRVVESRRSATLDDRPRDRPGAEAPPPALAARLGVDGPEVDPEPRRSYRDPADVGEDELIAALDACDWNVRATAAALGVSRGSLYGLIEASPRVRKARDLTAPEILESLGHHPDDLGAAARHLRVSRMGLKRRMSELGIDPRSEAS